MRIATWNINSVRLRQDLVVRALGELAPDVLCLQETKSPNDAFPARAFAAAGYGHALLAGMKGYNGVAILSRQPLTAVPARDWCERQDCRHIAAALPNGWIVHNFYVPSGGDIPDPETNPKFRHKLDFVAEMADWWPVTGAAGHPTIMVGDLNIAPLENDVWSHRQMLDVVSHTPVEVEALTAMQSSIGWVDAVRRVIPAEDKLYSWWSYRARDWEASDRGRRLDHIWVTEPLANRIGGAGILRQARGWEPKPSDHVPVWLDLTD
ncbi:MAG: exodeoxyribonuclease III [Rhodospirillaceae bacterium]|nr:exodeoxyribonuclease III [Rhodospirillaceae bacterium]